MVERSLPSRSPGLHWDRDPQRRAAATSCPPQKVPARREPPPPIRRRRQARGCSSEDRELEASVRRLEKLLRWPLSPPPCREISFSLPPRSRRTGSDAWRPFGQ